MSPLQNPVPATTFPQFTALPTEIQDQIWFAAFDNLPGRAIMLTRGRQVVIEEDAENKRTNYSYRFGLGHAVNPEPKMIDTCPQVACAYELYQEIIWTQLSENYRDSARNSPISSLNSDDYQFDSVQADLNKDTILFGLRCTEGEIIDLAEYIGPTTCAKIRHIGKLEGWIQNVPGQPALGPTPPSNMTFIYKCFPNIVSISLVRERDIQSYNMRSPSRMKRVLPRSFYTLVPSPAKHRKDDTTDYGVKKIADNWKQYCEKNRTPDLPCPSIEFKGLVRSLEHA